MATPGFFTRHRYKIIIILVILLVLVAHLYFASKEKEAILTILNGYFAPWVSEKLLAFSPVLETLIIVPLLINLLTSGSGKPHEENQNPQPTAPINITVKTELPQQMPDPPPAAGISQKFYPEPFLPDLKFFVGRKELLKQIKAALKKGHRAAIHDISGLGKTFTSCKFVEENQENYEKIFFIRATREEMLESLAKCGEMVNPGLAEVTEQQAEALGFKQWLEENENWLVIYDNVDLPDELFPFIPVGKNGDCIFTSNFKEVVSLVTKDAEIKIEKLDKKDAGILLYSRAENKPYSEPKFDNEVDKTAFNSLIEEIEGLPLTLNSTGAFISQEDATFAEFWQRFKDTVWDTEDKYNTYENRQQSRSAGKIFSLVYDELCKVEGTGQAVKAVLDSMAFISPDEIPSDLLLEILKSGYEPFAEIDDAEGFWSDVRKGLTSYDLLKYDKHKKTFTTHRAIQRVVQSRLIGKEKDICRGLSILMLRLFPRYDRTNRPPCERYYQHVLALMENGDNFELETEDTGLLYDRLARYQELLGNLGAAETFYIRSSEISATIFGAETADYAPSLNNLALVYKQQGRYDEAIKKYEKVLWIYEKTIGREHSEYATSLNNLAGVYYVQCKYDEALKKYEEALGIAEKTVGQAHSQYAGHLNNLASVYYEKGDLERAEKLYAQAKELREKTLGKLHPDTAVTYWWIGVLRSEQERYSEALPMFEEAYGQFVHFFGEEHTETKKLKMYLEICRTKSDK